MSVCTRCPHFREEKSHCSIILNMPAVFSFQEENRTATKQSDLAKQWPKTRQWQWLWAAVRGATRSQLWQATSASQGLWKYRHLKRCLQLFKHHVCIFPNHDSQRKRAKRGRGVPLPCNPAIANHSDGRAGWLATGALGFRFLSEAF